MRESMQDIPYKSLPEKGKDLIPEYLKRWRNLPFLFLACGIVFGSLYGYIAKKATAGNRGSPKEIVLPEHIESCVPFYDLLRSHVITNIGNRNAKRTKLSLLASYAYPDYSVVTLEADGWYGQKVYCRYFDKKWKELSPVESMVFPEFVVHCCKHPDAYYMSVTPTKDEENDYMVPVQERFTDPPPYLLSVCLAPFYGNDSKWLLLAELVEHYKLEGVEHFYFYLKDVDDYSRKVVNDYVKGGEAELVRFYRDQDRPLEEWRHVAMQDCVQRSRFHSRFTLFSDLDERILPLTNIGLAKYLLKYMAYRNDIGMMEFSPRWVLRTREPPTEYRGAETLLKHLPTLVFHNTSALAPRGLRAKCVVDSKKVMLMLDNKVLIYFRRPIRHVPTVGEPDIRYIGSVAPPDEAIIRRYRYVDTDDLNSTEMSDVESSGPFEMMKYPEEKGEVLFRNVQARLDHVYKINY